MGKVVDIVDKAIRDTIESLGYELIEVDYSKKYDSMNLTITIDNDGGISLDDCEKVHKTIDSILDDLNPTNDIPYVLNVSSKGLDRPLKTNRDFDKNIGKDIEVSLYSALNKLKKYTGELICYSEKDIIIKYKNENITIEKTLIAVIKPALKF